MRPRVFSIHRTGHGRLGQGNGFLGRAAQDLLGHLLKPFLTPPGTKIVGLVPVIRRQARSSRPVRQDGHLADRVDFPLHFGIGPGVGLPRARPSRDSRGRRFLRSGDRLRWHRHGLRFARPAPYTGRSKRRGPVPGESCVLVDRIELQPVGSEAGLIGFMSRVQGVHVIEHAAVGQTAMFRSRNPAEPGPGNKACQAEQYRQRDPQRFLHGFARPPVSFPTAPPRRTGAPVFRGAAKAAQTLPRQRGPASRARFPAIRPSMAPLSPVASFK